MKNATHKVQKSVATPVYVGDYAAECEEGRRRGHELIAKMRATELPILLGFEIRKCIDSNDPQGVIVGLCHVVSEAVIYGRLS